MSSFFPLNVEIEEESEEEIDDSKEIQIEEALKLYHNVLRLHSQGPLFYDAADVAYRELFRSEIFTYPESLSEAQRLELYEDVEDSQDDLDDALAPTLVAPVTSTDGAPSTLPQILYLAYKNHGQFILDRLKHQLSRLELDIRSDHSRVQQQNALAASASLKLFVEALDRDESDLQLWRQTSRIGGFLGSQRITRFCLEAVLDSDENDFEAWAEPLGLEEGFAIEQLKPLLLSLEDQLSESQLSALSKRQNQSIHALRKHSDPLPFLPTTPLNLSANPPSTATETQIIGIPLRTWASCGQAILLQLNQEAQGVINPAPGANYCLVLPAKELSASSGPLPKFLTNGDSNVGHNVLPVTIAQESLQTARLLADRGATVGNWLGHAEPSQPSPIEMDVQIIEQPLESPTKFVEAGNPVEVQNPGTRRISVQETVQPTGLVSLPTRKRSSEAAELPESTEGRSRSKRIKARGATDPDNFRDTTADDWARWYEQQLQIYHQADDIVFASIQRMLSTIAGRKPSDLSSLRKLIFPPQSIAGDTHAELGPEPSDVAPLDLKNALDSWDLAKGKAFLNGHDPKDPAAGIGGAQNPSFTAFLEHSNQEMQQAFQIPVLSDEAGIEQFVEAVNNTWTNLGQLSFRWINELLGQHPQLSDDNQLDDLAGLRSSSYKTFLWPNDLKQSIVQILVNQDDAIYTEIHAMIASMDYNQINQPHLKQHDDGSRRNCMLLVQAIFELHLDVYGRITNPSSIVDTAIRLQQRDRLARWAALSSKMMNEWSETGSDTGTVAGESQSERDLYIRFMWAYVVCNSLMEPDSRDMTVLCFQDLIRVLKDLEQEIQGQGPVKIELPNNAIIPEISIQAAQKEISRLTTMDFFMGVFSTENNDPLTIIESLEPLLELSVKYAKLENDDAPNAPTLETDDAATDASPRGGENGSNTYPDAKFLEALHFLDQGSLPLRLFLWQKMRDAYRAINYPPQVLACDLRILELIVKHLSSPSFTESAAEIRRDSLLRWLHRLDDHMTRILSIVSSKGQAFECVDSDQIVTSLEALAGLQNLLHVFALWEDTIRVGQTPAPITQTQAASKALAKSTDKFRDMIVKSWTLQHSLLKEAMVQYDHLFPQGKGSLVNLLEHMHYALGLRCYCSLANKCFLKLMKAELEKAHHAENWDTDMAQLIFDLYGVKISSNAAEMQDHGCLPDELDRRTALEIMDLVMLQVHRISIRDLLKSDLKFTVDKMQQVIKIPKILNSQARTFNNRLVNNYLKSPINPLDLYRSLQGIGGLCGRPVDTEGFEIAARGWYFLLGHVALAKFRSQKRTAAGATDDLEIARTFLRHDLEFDTERWETWYRLAQVYDTMIDEDATWTAEKLENDMNELAVKQRKAIHCYSMAVAIATRCADPSFEDTSKMADLYADFGTRVYASTREPFSMKAFELEDFQRHYNSRQVGMYQSVPFKPLQIYSAWKLASTLLRRASAQKPQNWILSYNLGKVLWKMWDYADRRPHTKRLHYRLPIDAFLRAIKTCPDKRDSRHPEKDPILEPHYKLVSVVHKLVRRASISPDEGFHILQTTPYACKATEVYDVTRWNMYILHVLKALRSADKANWHHRMVARAAHTLFDDEPHEPQANLGAKHELSQSIFTKTMAIQVWKPDNERAGRHFIYTGRYVRFMTRLLYNLNDKTGMELLARRIRKRSGEFVNHAGVWEEVSRAYLQLLRHQPICPVPEGLAEHKFQGMDPEIYQNNAARLETWMQSQTTSPPSLDILREAIELQKMNNKLFKSNSFEDLIRDVYAHLYDSVIPELHAEENRVRMRVDNILTNPISNAVGTPPPDASAAQGEQHRSKAKWVTNREIIRKAEAIAAQRAPSVPAKVLKALAPAPALEQGRPSSGNPNLTVVINADGDREAGSSVPGSVHDSADDESELSEVDEAVMDIKPEVKAEILSTVYPNLISAKGGTADDPEEIDDETGAEANEEAEDNEDMEMRPEMQQATPAKESGVPTGKW